MLFVVVGLWLSAIAPRADTAVATPEPHRSTSDPDQRYYGEAPVQLWRGYGGLRAYDPGRGGDRR
jgi:hypothetical protein